MNDQQAAVEALATVSNILDVLDSDITAFATLRGQWRSPRVPVHVFERHLTAFRDAIARLKRWIALGPFDTLALYSRQLKLCLSCCRLLATRIHVEISHFRTVPARELVASRHHDLGFNKKGFYDIQNALDVQRTALLHVLSEMSGCDSAAESVSEGEDLKGDIEAPPVGWQALQMDIDNIRSSMAVHSDPDLLRAFYSGSRIVSSKAALVFNLDKPPSSLQQPRQREGFFIEWVKQFFSRSSPEPPGLSSRAAKRRSWEIDQFLAHQSEVRWRRLQVLRLGMRTRVNFVSFIKTRHLSINDRRGYRKAVRKNLIDGYKSLVWAAAGLGSDFHGTETQEYLNKLSSLLESDFAPSLLFEDIAETIIGLHQDTHIQDLIVKPPAPLHPTQFSLQNAGRILSPDFIPTDLDIARLPPNSFLFREETMHLGRLDLAVIELGGCGPLRRKFIHSLEETMAIFFTGELDMYDENLSEDDTVNLMKEQLILFDNNGGSRYFSNCPFILLLDGAEMFRKKLAVTPVKRHFPEYEGDGSFEDAAQFFVGKFHELNRSGRVIYTFVYDSTDSQSVDRVMDSLEEVLEQVGLKEVKV